MRVALVNDLTLAIEALRRVVCSTPDAEVAWIAMNGQEAVDHCRQDLPDLILMDLVMPVMNGVDATRAIMDANPCPILVTTATLTGNCEMVYDALGAGAVDAVETPVLGTQGDLQGGAALLRKMRTVLRISNCASFDPPHRDPCPPAATVDAQVRVPLPPLVAVGASTGGPLAIRQMLSDIGRRDLAIVIVQHLELAYVAGFAEWLADDTRWPVSLIEDGVVPSHGQVFLACTGDHLVIDHHGRFRHVAVPAETLHRPSIDVFFQSLAGAGIEPGIAVLLTGMGRDGAVGMKCLREVNWLTIAQDEQSSVVWGMPRAAVQAEAASRTLPLNEIGPAVDRLTLNGRTQD